MKLFLLTCAFAIACAACARRIEAIRFEPGCVDRWHPSIGSDCRKVPA